MSNIDEIFTECFEELFSRVGLEYPNTKLTDQPDWYMKYSWTIEEEKDYSKWVYKHLKKKLKMTKKKTESEVAFFVMNYGWTTKDIK